MRPTAAASRRTSAPGVARVRPPTSTPSAPPVVSVPVLSKSTVSTRPGRAARRGCLADSSPRAPEHAHRRAERDRRGQRQRARARDDQHGRGDARAARPASGHHASAPAAARRTARDREPCAEARAETSVSQPAASAWRTPGSLHSAASRLFDAGRSGRREAARATARPPARTRLAAHAAHRASASPVTKRSRSRRRPSIEHARRRARPRRGRSAHAVAGTQRVERHEHVAAGRARRAPTAAGTSATCDRRPFARTPSAASSRPISRKNTSPANESRKPSPRPARCRRRCARTARPARARPARRASSVRARSARQPTRK